VKYWKNGPYDAVLDATEVAEYEPVPPAIVPAVAVKLDKNGVQLVVLLDSNDGFGHRLILGSVDVELFAVPVHVPPSLLPSK
jgi:hypothetical protein